ncbi:MAG: hypothetical protein ACUVUR_05435 [bacterium]
MRSHKMSPRWQMILSFTICILSFTRAGVSTFVPDEGLFSSLDQIEFKNSYLSATGNIRLAPAPSLLCSLEDAAIWAITFDRSGNGYLGTGNQNRLYRLVRGGRQSLLLFGKDAGEILTASTGPDNTVYFGTTPQGVVWRVLPGAQPESLLATGETYIHALIPAPDRSVICATGPNGKLFRIHPDRRSELIFTAPATHITSLCWFEPGRELLLGTSATGTLYRLRFSAPEAKPQASVLFDTPLEEIRDISTDGRFIYLAANPGTEAEGEQKSNQPVIYCLDPEGIISWQWICPEAVVFNLTFWGGQIIALTGNRGIVYSLDSLGQPAIFCQLSEPQALIARLHNKRLYLGTGNPARLYLFTDGCADSGFVTSPVFDCGNPARFGRIDFRAKVPQGTEVFFDTRSGNSGKPDSLWSIWQSAADKILSPPARFIQWRARLYSRFPNITPELERVDLYYRTLNRAPLISKLEINQIDEPDARKGNAQPKRELSWVANDPDSDSLIYQLFIKPEGENSWLQLDRNITEPRYEIDTRTIPDGWYRIRLVATDAFDHPDKTALSAERLSPPFIIDNTPPQISEIMVYGNRVSWTVKDNLSPLVACRISVNAGHWKPVEPEDGIFDEPEERFSTVIEPTKGINTIAVWAADGSGNQSSRRRSLTAR